MQRHRVEWAIKACKGMDEPDFAVNARRILPVWEAEGATGPHDFRSGAIILRTDPYVLNIYRSA